MLKKYILGVVLISMSASFVMAEDCNYPLTEKDVLEYKKAWGDGIVAIGDAYQNGGDYKELAKKFIDTMYAYDDGGVLFKPTKAREYQFRDTKEKALSYFIGGRKKEDHGFAIHTWSKVRFEKSNILIDSDSALVMGDYYFTDEPLANSHKQPII